MNKDALHAGDRIKERLNMPPESIDQIQKAVDRMWFSFGRKKLNETHYYIPVKDHENIVKGYVALQRVGNPRRSRLVVTTVLDRNMKPKGSNIGSFLNTQVNGHYLSDGYQPKKYDKLPDLPNNKQ